MIQFTTKMLAQEAFTAYDCLVLHQNISVISRYTKAIETNFLLQMNTRKKKMTRRERDLWNAATNATHRLELSADTLLITVLGTVNELHEKIQERAQSGFTGSGLRRWCARADSRAGG